MEIGVSVTSGLGAVFMGLVITCGYLFLRGYFEKAGAIVAKKTPVLKAETVNKPNKDDNLDILNQLEELREEKENIRKTKQNQIETYESELSDYERLIESIQDESVARKRLIKNYWKPLHALVACFTKSKVETDDGEKNFVLEALRRGRNVEQITGSTYIVPPRDVPSRIKSNPDSREALESWIEDEVYADHPEALAHIAMFGLVDLRNVYSSSDYEQEELTHFFSTIDWEFELEDMFSAEDFSRMLANESVNLTEIIEKGDIAFLASKSVTPEELDGIQNAQDEIESELDNPNVKQLASEVSRAKILGALSPYVADPERVAGSVKEEANIWSERLFT